MPKEPTVQAWAWRLKDLMRERGRTGRLVERELGWGTGYMSQILRDGPPALKVGHVLAIVQAIGVTPAEYFAGLYGLEPAPPADPAELRRVVREILAEERREHGGRPDEVRDFVRQLMREEGAAGPIDRAEIREVVSDVVREELLRLVQTPRAPEAVPAGDGGRSGARPGRRGRSKLERRDDEEREER
jgi:hypothetical protein